MKWLDKIISVLGIPAAYRLFFLIVGGDVRKIYTTEYVKAQPGEKVLDIGCGPGDILEYLPDVKYTGFDLSPEYIEAAKKRFGERGRFFLQRRRLDGAGGGKGHVRSCAGYGRVAPP